MRVTISIEYEDVESLKVAVRRLQMEELAADTIGDLVGNALLSVFDSDFGFCLDVAQNAENYIVDDEVELRKEMREEEENDEWKRN